MISVLITNYNKSKFLKKSLKSVISNRYKKYEIILFDDASTDSSLKVLKQFKNIRLITNKKKIYKSPALIKLMELLNVLKFQKEI